MHKTPLKHTAHKRSLKHNPKSDLEKIKAFLRATTQNARDSAEETFNESIESAREKSLEVQGYISERPVKAVGVSLLTGLLAGLFIGYWIKK